MSDAVIRGADPDVLHSSRSVPRSPLSWSAAIAGAFTGTAVTLITIALGSGIGLSFASPYGAGASATSLTIGAAIWLLMAETFGFAVGGYMAARLRSPALDGVPGETTFRDAAQGFLVWGMGVVVTAAALAFMAVIGAGASARVAAGISSGTAAQSEPTSANPAEYYVDLLFRPGSGAATAGGQPNTVGAGGQGALNNETRAEVMRVLAHGIAQGGLDANDRSHLADLVSAPTGLPPDQAQQRVATVETQSRDAIKSAADKTAKAVAYFSFWTFMALLFGAMAATLAAIEGGQLRDAEGRIVAAG
jgi:hypothetical protein